MSGVALFSKGAMFDTRDALLVVLLNAVSFLLRGPCCAPFLPDTVWTNREANDLAQITNLLI